MKHKSKFLSFILRHKPESIGLSLDTHGWADIEDLLTKASTKEMNITYDELLYIVQNNDKKRFSISEDGKRIRANQGHSINVYLELKEEVPPKVLYHGTATKFLDSILSSGINKRTRQYVHLSRDAETAVSVGKRHGNPIVLVINSAQMYKDGFKFYLSENLVWLTDNVPTKYIESYYA